MPRSNDAAYGGVTLGVIGVHVAYSAGIFLREPNTPNPRKTPTGSSQLAGLRMGCVLV